MIHYLSSPKYFYRLLTWLKAPVELLTLIAFLIGIYWIFFLTPLDSVQGYTFRIIYIHVPAAICSLGLYTALTVLSCVYLIWPLKIADLICSKVAGLGLMFTSLVLITGCLWGKPMWGTWWIWDARLTSELLLAFIYLAYMVLRHTMDGHPKKASVAAIFACIGFVDLPIIHYSVTWWNTLHQGPSLLKFGWPSIHESMLWPLLLMIAAFMCYCALIIINACLYHQLDQRKQHDQLYHYS